MSAPEQTLPLTRARHYAQKCAEWLAPHCHRIEIAGSIRRSRPQCGDLDLVVIPKVDITADLLGARSTLTNHLHDFLVKYVKEHAQEAAWLQGEDQPEGKIWSLKLPRAQLDLFPATEANWGAAFLSRTGSTEHNIWLARRCQDRRMAYKPGLGIIDAKGNLLPAATEEQIYNAVGLHGIAPHNREADWLARNLPETY